ncbi:hypothetical protein Ancab_008885 [Ancistrocladus abbreviatus]
MFPLNQSGELSFQISNAADQQEEEEDQDLQMLLANINASGLEGGSNIQRGNNNLRKGGRGKRGNQSLLGGANLDNNVDEEFIKQKKKIHRDIERQRRQEMAKLHSSLRSLLPPENIKGKRSVCDHLGEAVNYIKQLQNNVKELGHRRDKLRESKHPTKLATLSHEKGGTSNCSSNESVAIYARHGRLDIEIKSCLGGDGFALSQALKIVHEEGLHVISCVYNKANQMCFRIIQCEVGDSTCIDTSRLQQRLADLICSGDS